MHAAYAYGIYALALIGRFYATYRTVDQVIAAPDAGAAITALVIGIVTFVAIGSIARSLVGLAR